MFITMQSSMLSCLIPELHRFLLLCCLASCSLGLAAQEQRIAPGIELPEGQHRALVERVCTRCHDLKGLQAYKGYWNREQWKAMVDTMVKHGASLGPDQSSHVIDYLTEHFGRTPVQK